MVMDGDVTSQNLHTSIKMEVPTLTVATDLILGQLYTSTPQTQKRNYKVIRIFFDQSKKIYVVSTKGLLLS